MGQEHLGFGPMFGHQYSHVWVDFRGLQDDYMRARGLDFVESGAVHSGERGAISSTLLGGVAFELVHVGG